MFQYSMVAVVLGIAGLTGALRSGYTDGPLPGHTGGFGEPTCHACHFEEAINDPAGSLNLRGIEDGRFVPGRRYRLTVELERPEMRLAGFQLAVRFASEPRAAEQAGSLTAIDSLASVIVWGDPPVQYARHTASGSDNVKMGKAMWAVDWIAPVEAADLVIHVAANAANDDASEFGDYIYVDSLVLAPADR
jgi:hypothetical protein